MPDKPLNLLPIFLFPVFDLILLLFTKDAEVKVQEFDGSTKVNRYKF